MRAIERGLPLIRAANSGISGVIDPYGRLVVRLPLGEQGSLDSKIPERLSSTLYVDLGETFLIAFLGVFLATAFLLDRKRD